MQLNYCTDKPDKLEFQQDLQTMIDVLQNDEWMALQKQLQEFVNIKRHLNKDTIYSQLHFLNEKVIHAYYDPLLTKRNQLLTKRKGYNVQL